MCLVANNQSKTLFMLSQVALLLFFLMSLPAHLAPRFHPDLMDGVRGVFLGIAIAGMLLTAWRNRRGNA